MRRIPSVIALLLLAVSCTGTGSGTTTAAAPPTGPPQTTTSAPTPTTGSVTVVEPVSGSLTLWAPSGVVGSLAGGVDAFSSVTGVEVTVVERSLDETIDAVRRGDIPDVFYGHHAWIVELATGGVLEPIFIDGADGMPGSALDAFRLRGTLYGVPLAVRSGAMLRNTALVASPVESTTGFVTACLAVADGDPCILVPSTSGEIHFPFLAAGGGYLFGYSDAAGYDRADIGFTAEGADAGFSELEALVGGGRIAIAPEGSPFAAFGEGRAAFLLVGPDEIEDAVAALADSGVGFAMDPLPKVGDATSPPLLDAFGLFVNAHSADKVPASVLVSEYLAGPLRPTIRGDRATLLAIAADGVRRPQIVEADLAFQALAQAASLVYGGTTAEQALGEGARTLRALLDEPDDEPGDERDEGEGNGG